MRPEVERVQNLLSDTVTLLCKNGLTYDKEMKVQGLLGITLDEKEVFVVHFNELLSNAVEDIRHEDEEEESLSAEETVTKPTKESKSSKRPHSNSSIDLTLVKTEKDNDVIMLDTKPEPGSLSSNEHGPSSKRRISNNPSLSSGTITTHGGPYVTGIVQHSSDSSSLNWDSSQPPNTTLSPSINTLASPTPNNHSNNSNLPVLDQTSASWDPSRHLAQNLTNQQPNLVAPLSPDRTEIALFTKSEAHCKRLPKTPDNKFFCDIDGCNKTFKQSFILYRHQREKHGSGYIRPQAARSYRQDNTLALAALQCGVDADGETASETGLEGTITASGERWLKHTLAGIKHREDDSVNVDCNEAEFRRINEVDVLRTEQIKKRIEADNRVAEDNMLDNEIQIQQKKDAERKYIMQKYEEAQLAKMQREQSLKMEEERKRLKEEEKRAKQMEKHARELERQRRQNERIALERAWLRRHNEEKRLRLNEERGKGFEKHQVEFEDANRQQFEEDVHMQKQEERRIHSEEMKQVQVDRAGSVNDCDSIVKVPKGLETFMGTGQDEMLDEEEEGIMW